jgi:predicted GNAT family acetyltransferase
MAMRVSSRASLDGAQENLIAALTLFTGIGQGAEVADEGGWRLLDGGDGFDHFNVAMPHTGTTPDIDTAARWFAQRRRRYRMVLREKGDARTLRASAERGFRRTGAEPLMMRTLTRLRPVPGDVQCRRVDDEQGIRAFATLEPVPVEDAEARVIMARRAAGHPGCRLYLGVRDGTAVARAMALQDGSTVGLYNVFVVPRARRRGAASTITSVALADARMDGATTACLTASEEGVALFGALGFRMVDTYVDAWPA